LRNHSATPTVAISRASARARHNHVAAREGLARRADRLRFDFATLSRRCRRTTKAANTKVVEDLCPTTKGFGRTRELRSFEVLPIEQEEAERRRRFGIVRREGNYGGPGSGSVSIRRRRSIVRVSDGGHAPLRRSGGRTHRHVQDPQREAGSVFFFFAQGVRRMRRGDRSGGHAFEVLAQARGERAGQTKRPGAAAQRRKAVPDGLGGRTRSRGRCGSTIRQGGLDSRRSRSSSASDFFLFSRIPAGG